MRLLTLIALALLTTACAQRDQFLLPMVEPQSAYGSFLAARYANSARDVEESARLYSQALSFEPRSSLLAERAFISALMAGDFERADTSIAAAGADENAPRLIWVYAGIANLDGARLDPGPEPERAPDDLSVLVQRVLVAWRLIDRGRAQAAADELATSGIPPRSLPYAHIHQGLVYEAAGRFSQAEEAYVNAVSTQLDANYPAVMYGEFLERRGRKEDAQGLYRALLSRSGAFPDPDIRAALARVERGERAPRFPSARQGAARALFTPASFLISEAPADYAALYTRMVQRLDPAFARNSMALAKLLEELELYEAAETVYAQIDDGPWAPDAAVSEAALAFTHGDRERGLQLAREATERSDSVGASLLLADMLRASGNCEAALPLYLEGAQRRPTDQHPLFFAGLCRDLIEGWDAAEPLFLEGLERAPNDPQLLNHVGYSWIVQNRRVDEGFAMVERAADLEPENGSILDSLGWGYFKQGRYAQALEALELAASLSPENPTINWHLGDAYAAAGRFLEARFQWQRALELDPDPEEVVLIERRLALGLEAGPSDIE